MISSVFSSLLKKDFRLLFGTREYLAASVLLSAGMFIFFRFMLAKGSIESQFLVVPLVAAFQISALFLVFVTSSQDTFWKAGSISILSNIDSSVVFLSHFMGMLCALFVLYIGSIFLWSILILPAGVSILNESIIPVLLAGITSCASLAALGPLLSILSLHSRLGQLVLVILYFPLGLPAVSGSAMVVREAINGTFVYTQLGLSAAFALIYLAAGIFLYGYFRED